MTMARKQPNDGRHEVALELAERELKLSDPVDPQPSKLADLLHPDARWWVQKFDRFMTASLGQAARRPEPVVIPNVATLRPLIWGCQDGHSGEFNHSPAWRAIWGTDGGSVQSSIRGLFMACRSHNYPRPEQYEQLVAALADHIVALHEQAAEFQRNYLAKRAERQGPKARTAAAHAVLEHIANLQTALLAFDAATKGAGGSRWHEVAYGLQHLEAAAKEALS